MHNVATFAPGTKYLRAVVQDSYGAVSIADTQIEVDDDNSECDFDSLIDELEMSLRFGEVSVVLQIIITLAGILQYQKTSLMEV